MSASLDDPLMRIPDVAALTGASEATIRQWRHRGVGPVSAKLGRRVVYRRSDVVAWIDAQFAAAEAERAIG